MSRPKTKAKQKAARPERGAGKARAAAAPPLPAPARRGPPTSLTSQLVEGLASWLRRGRTRRQAAALEGIPEARLQAWLTRGRLELAELEREDAAADAPLSVNAHLVLAVDRAEAEYQGGLLDKLDESMEDKTVNDKPIRWRLSVASPKDFTVPREAPVPAGGGALGPAFELVSPEQAMATLEEKLGRFLKDEAARAELEAQVAAQDAAGGTGDGG